MQVQAAVPGFLHWFLGVLLARVLVLAWLCLQGRSFTHCTTSLGSLWLVFSAGAELLSLAITSFHIPTCSARELWCFHTIKYINETQVLGMVVYLCNLYWLSEAEGLLRVQVQPGLHGEGVFPYPG